MTSLVGNDAPLPWADGLYSIKRHGVTLTNCDTEPVQTPGCIQAHGALLVLRLTNLTILQASENSQEHLGLAPERLLGEPVARVVGSAHAAKLRKLLDQGPVERNALFAFTLPARDAAAALDVCVHTVDGVAVLEFEATDRAANDDERDLFGLVKLAVARLQAAQSVREFCQRVTQEVRQLTGLDRVMVYRFHADQHGEVFAESRRDDLPAWLGLHYPEGDIPRPAREIFKSIGVRPLPNAAT